MPNSSIRILLLVFIVFGLPAFSAAQFIDRTTTFDGGNEPDHTMHLHDASCSVDFILTDPQSIQALENYHELRREQPEGALVPSLYSSAEVGDTRSFNVRNLVTNRWNSKSFTLRARSERVLIWVEDGEFAPDRVNSEVIDGLMGVMEESTPSLSFDPSRGIMDINKEIFGNLPNVDGSNTLNILITDVIDGWTPDSGTTVAGFFDPVDLDPNNSNSNAADIIYLNSRPIIHLDGVVNVNAPQSVASHELQHLIHANYGALHIFQNEGQSEWAELLTGFSGRTPRYFLSPNQVDRYLYSWRRGSSDVLFDYQRASMLHSYISQRIGEEQAGAVTRAANGFNAAYGSVINNFDEFLLEFHIANFLNNNSVDDGRFGYEDIRRRANRVRFANFTFFSGQTSGSGTRSVDYGGAEYVEWIGAENLNLTISGDSDMRFGLIKYPVAQGAMPEVEIISQGSYQFSGAYARVVLTATGGGVGTFDTSDPPQYTFSFDSNWDTLPFIVQLLDYDGNPEFFQELPGNPNNPNRSGIREMTKRFTPEFDATIQEVNFPVNGRDSSLVGDGNLRIVFAENVGTGSARLPNVRLDSLEVPLSQLVRGENTIDLSGMNWQMDSSNEYHLIFRVVNPDDRVEFLLDSGSSDTSNPNYNPARTLLYITPPSVNSPGWFSLQNRNNFIANIRISGQYDGPLEEPVITSQPQSAAVDFESSHTLSVSASGVPNPIYQWYKDGEPLYGENQSSFTIESMDTSKEGVYTVLVSNPAGSELSEPALLTTSFDEYVLEQNFPNPFRLSTTFQFVLPEESTVSLEIYDTIGRRVGRVVAGETLAEGLHQRQLSVGSADSQNSFNYLTSGVYLYRFTARSVNGDRSFERTGKMMYLRN